MTLRALTLPGAEVQLDPAWMPAQDADALLDALLRGVPWETHRIRLFGRQVDSPRLSCWIGDPGASYRYSGKRFEPHAWPAALVPVRDAVSRACGVGFDSVLANRYRDGRDGMGWHRDDEPELGPAPVIASLSLGASRRFALKSLDGAHRLALDLPHGSLLVMRGATQRNYRHALPKTARAVGERVNLTFRRIVPGAA